MDPLRIAWNLPSPSLRIPLSAGLEGTTETTPLPGSIPPGTMRPQRPAPPPESPRPRLADLPLPSAPPAYDLRSLLRGAAQRRMTEPGAIIPFPAVPAGDVSATTAASTGPARLLPFPGSVPADSPAPGWLPQSALKAGQSASAPSGGAANAAPAGPADTGAGAPLVFPTAVLKPQAGTGPLPSTPPSPGTMPGQDAPAQAESAPPLPFPGGSVKPQAGAVAANLPGGKAAATPSLAPSPQFPAATTTSAAGPPPTPGTAPGVGPTISRGPGAVPPRPAAMPGASAEVAPAPLPPPGSPPTPPGWRAVVVRDGGQTRVLLVPEATEAGAAAPQLAPATVMHLVPNAAEEQAVVNRPVPLPQATQQATPQQPVVPWPGAGPAQRTPRPARFRPQRLPRGWKQRDDNENGDSAHRDDDAER